MVGLDKVFVVDGQPASMREVRTMKADFDKLAAAVKLLRDEVSELEGEFANWDAGSTAGGKRLRFIARRIVLGSQRLEVLVKENTYSS